LWLLMENAQNRRKWPPLPPSGASAVALKICIPFLAVIFLPLGFLFWVDLHLSLQFQNTMLMVLKGVTELFKDSKTLWILIPNCRCYSWLCIQDLKLLYSCSEVRQKVFSQRVAKFSAILVLWEENVGRLEMFFEQIITRDVEYCWVILNFNCKLFESRIIF
jgi:hypothetical protein